MPLRSHCKVGSSPLVPQDAQEILRKHFHTWGRICLSFYWELSVGLGSVSSELGLHCGCFGLPLCGPLERRAPAALLAGSLLFRDGRSDRGGGGSDSGRSTGSLPPCPALPHRFSPTRPRRVPFSPLSCAGFLGRGLGVLVSAWALFCSLRGDRVEVASGKVSTGSSSSPSRG